MPLHVRSTDPERAAAEHENRVAALRAQFTTQSTGSYTRLAKSTSNLFRMRADRSTTGLDVSGFTHVLHVDPEARTADVEGMVTYEQLVDAVLPYGLMPVVVPQLKSITIGGAVTGLGIESSSFRGGMPHESVLELEILTGDGQVIVARPDGEHRDLFFGFPNSYGTLGYALRLRIELEPVRKYVRLQHIRYRDPVAYFAEVERVCRAHTADFVDGTVFGPQEMYLTLGTFVDEAPETSDYTWLNIYYRSIRERTVDHLPVRDYLWRWDTDWFWCSRALGVQNRLTRLLLGPNLLRSDVYWPIVAFERRHRVLDTLKRGLGQPPREAVMQDVEVPVERAAEFLDFFQQNIPINPVWICPMRQRDPDRVWSLYPLDPQRLYVNFGFWATVALGRNQSGTFHNRLIEDTVTALEGRKSLYSESFYAEETFWQLYNGQEYHTLKNQYDPEHRLLDLYDKCVRAR